MASIREFAAARAAGRKLVMVTCYDAWSARLLADAPVDALLVGDSVMNVIHGERETLGATAELIALHVRAVARGAPEKLIIADMPFLAARKGIEHALDSAASLMRAGAHAIKIEGIRGHADVVSHLVGSGIPVMGHLGLTPQWVNVLGGHRVQGRSEAEAGQLLEDVAAVEAAGAFSVVLELVPRKLAEQATASVGIPTIGIGAGAGCSGQVLVLHDLLGLNPGFNPRFVRRFADGAALVRKGVADYAEAVRRGEYPSDKEAFD